MNELRYFGVYLETDGLNESRRRVPLDTPRAVLRATTKGSVRELPLDRRQLIRLIGEAAQVLQGLERLEGER